MALQPALRCRWAPRQPDLVGVILNPASARPWAGSRAPVLRFSTSAPLWKRKDYNKNRGVSERRRTGLRRRQTLSVSLQQVPVPVLDPDQRSKVEGDPNHGLWGFFKDRRLLSTPEQLGAHGRAWTVNELRQKSWDDLHCLWWVCVKERNCIATNNVEHQRLKAGYGEYEALERDKAVKMTMKAIKHTLTERWYAWEAARKLAKDDGEVNLSGDGPAYVPGVVGGDNAYYTPEELDVEIAKEDEAKDGERPTTTALTTPSSGAASTELTTAEERTALEAKTDSDKKATPRPKGLPGQYFDHPNAPEKPTLKEKVTSLFRR